MEVIKEKSYTFYNLIENISFWFRYLLSKWMLLALFSLAGSLWGIGYAWLKKPIYTSTLVFATENNSQSGLGSYAGLAAQFGIDLGGGSGVFDGENLIQLFKSKNLIQKTLLSTAPVEYSTEKKILLIDYYINSKNLRKNKGFEKISFNDTSNKPNRLRDSFMTDVTKKIIDKALQVEKIDRKLNFVSVVYIDDDEWFAKTFTEKLTENAIVYYTNYRVKKSKQNVEILQFQLDSVRRLLSGGIAQIAQSTDLNINPMRQKVRVTIQNKQIDMQANGAVYTELLKNLELSKIALRKEVPFIQIIDTPQYPLAKKKPGRLFTGILFGFFTGIVTAFILIVKRLLKQSLHKEPVG